MPLTAEPTLKVLVLTYQIHFVFEKFIASGNHSDWRHSLISYLSIHRLILVSILLGVKSQQMRA